MVIQCKFEYEQRVRHRLNEFEGFITGIGIRAAAVQYEVLPLTDNNANWREPVWIDERLLREKTV